MLYTPSQGWLMIGLYAILMILTTMVFSGTFSRQKEQFLVAGRSLGKWKSAFSIAATWIWAPALFISAQKAYTHGLAGFFWFTVPNVLSLILFAFFADIIREKLPEGFSFSGYIRERLSDRVQALYIIEFTGLAVCSFAVQLLAGGKIISAITGVSYFPLTIALALTALSYSFFLGLKASVITDYVQILWIILVLIIVVPWAIVSAGGIKVLLNGLGGISGDYNNVFQGKSLNVALSFGLPVTIGLLAGPFGDQSFWQRAFATERNSVKSSFIWGALIFVTVPVMMSALGFLAAGMNLQTLDPAQINLETIIMLLPTWTVIPFVVMLLSGLTSTLDSNLCSISCIAGHDIAEKFFDNKRDDSVVISRIGMAVLVIAAVCVANIKGIKILHLFLFYGTLRASTLLPTMIILLIEKVSESGVFWGILTSMIIGLPVFAYGKYTNNIAWIVSGSLLSVFLSGCITLGCSFIYGKKVLLTIDEAI